MAADRSSWPSIGRLLSVAPGLPALLAPLAASQAAESAPAPPNIVMFLVDDMGWQDTSVPFYTEMTPQNREFHTPNMERLAAEGMKFVAAYACPICSPTRVSLLTGLSAARHRVTSWTLRKDVATDAEHPTLRIPQWNINGLSPVAGVPRTVCAPTLPALLKERGYRTIHVGKAHWGAQGTPGEDPTALGFDVNIAGHAAGAPGSYLGTQNFSSAGHHGDRIWDVPGLDQYHGKDIFLTEALTLEANRQMDRAVADGMPFFLYMAHYAVHVPYAADKRFYQKYRDAGLEEGEAMYAALIEGMDKSLGDILKNLERNKVAGRTIVLFMSDNGGYGGPPRQGKPYTQNAPLSSSKGSVREGGIRVPMIVRWPGVTPPASVCRRYVIIEDFFPTILEMAGPGGRPAPPVDGVSFVPLLRQTAGYPAGRPLIWHEPNYPPGYTGPGMGPASAIRQGDWKLIYYHADRRCELFNLAQDIGEKHDLARGRPEIRRRLAAALGEQLRQRGAQMPIDKKTGRRVALPGADVDFQPVPTRHAVPTLVPQLSYGD